MHESINFGPASTAWQEGEPRINKMVFIGPRKCPFGRRYFNTLLGFFPFKEFFKLPFKKARQCFSLVPGKDLDKEALREGFGKCMHVDLPAWKKTTLPNNCSVTVAAIV